MRSRFMRELTTPEVEAFFKDGGKTAVLPVGSVEMHGPHLPVGTDMFIANAFSLRLAQETNGLVLPEIQYTWAGSTDGFAGTISIDIDLQLKLVEAVLTKASRMGFTRLVLISVHGPNSNSLFINARRFFETARVPVLFSDPFVPYHDSIRALCEGEYGASHEASLLLASLHILGLTELYSEQDMSYDDQAPAFPDSFLKLTRFGSIGYFMDDIRQHVCPSRFVSLKRGMEFIDRQIEMLKPALDDLDRYQEVISLQTNKGFW